MCKTFVSVNPLSIMFGEKYGFINNFDGIRYLVLFSRGWYDAIYSGIRYLINEKRGVTDSINHNFARIRINSYNFWPIEKILTFHDLIILIKSVVNKNENKYNYNIFLEKGCYKDKSNKQ